MTPGKTGGRFSALFLKELRHIRHDRRLMISLVIPPTLQVLLFGFALDSEISNLRLGVVDHSRSRQSRELVSLLTNNRSFRLAGYYSSMPEMQQSLDRNRLDVGVVLSPDFAEQQVRGDTSTVQVILNAVNANTAAIGEGYVKAAISAYNAERRSGITTVRAGTPVRLETRVALLFNPGLESSWFIVTGTLGILLILNGTLVAAASMIKEKESGTVEQLLMTPADALEIVLAKITPLFLLLMAMAGLVFTVAISVFGIPLRGSVTLLLFAAALTVITGIALGTLLATLAGSGQQTQLMALFVNPPLATLSGALTPIEAMPEWLQPVTLLNPIRHFADLARGVMVKGAGIDVLYPNLLALMAFAAVALSISMWQFRRQLR
jgi:ABC-2 type transport system permease protein